MPYYRLYYHFIWRTAGSQPLITNANQQIICSAIVAKAQELHAIVHAVNGMQEHVHLVVTVPPSIALSNFIGQVKGSSSHLASHYDTAHPTPFAWQSEYGVVSFSESLLPTVVAYVRNQQQHHADGTTNATLESYT